MDINLAYIVYRLYRKYLYDYEVAIAYWFIYTVYI